MEIIKALGRTGLVEGKKSLQTLNGDEHGYFQGPNKVKAGTTVGELSESMVMGGT